MSLEKSNITWSAKQITNMVVNGKINFDALVQRSLVWERSRKTKLIESMILGFPVPAIYAKKEITDESRKNCSKYLVLDGKQRLTTVKQYLMDEFALTDLPPVSYIDAGLDTEVETDISGMKFSELPEELQDIIKDTMFSITFFENLTDEEERDLFLRLNNGKALSTKSKVLAYCKDLKGLLDIGKHPLFIGKTETDTEGKEVKTSGMLTEKALDNKAQASIVMKIWCMINQDIDDVSFESKTFNPMIESTQISERDKTLMIEVMNFIVETHDILAVKRKPVAKKLYTEIHLVSLVPFFVKAMEQGINAELMADWIIDFFSTDNEKYDEASRSGSAKPISIQARNTELEKSFDNFFKEDIEEK